MAFGANFARAAEDDQAASARQRALELDDDGEAGSGPAAPSVSSAATVPSASIPAAAPRARFSRPTLNTDIPAAPAPRAAVSVAPAVAPAPTPAPAPVAVATPPATAVETPRRGFVRPSAFVRPVETPSASVVQAAQQHVVAAQTRQAPPASIVTATPAASGSVVSRFSRQPGTQRPAPAPAPAVPPVAVVAQASVPTVTETPSVAPVAARPRFFGRPSAAPVQTGSSAPVAARAGGFRATGMGEAPPRPTDEDDLADDHQPASSVSRASGPGTVSSPAPAPRPGAFRPGGFRAQPAPNVPTEASAPSVPVRSSAAPAPSRPARTGGFRGTNVGAGEAPPRPTGEEDELRAAAESRRSLSGLPVRLDRLIDVVCEHMGHSAEETAAIKKRALQDPDEISKEFDKIFKNEVEPLREQNAQRFKTLKEAIDTHPNKVVFMHIKDGKQGLVGLDRQKAGAAVMYEGQIIETVDASRTMFAPPSVLFAAQAAPETVNADEAAFDDSDPAPAVSAPRTPRL